jgi:tetratricopeptide (TPR) repeat protein
MYARATLGLTVCVAPHLLGGIYGWATAIIALIAVVAFALALCTLTQEVELGAEPLVWVFGAALLVTCAHAVPLPEAITRWVAPSAYANSRELALRLNGMQLGWIPFSQDPAGTWERVLYAVAVFAVFCAARITTAGSRGTTLLMIVALAVVSIALSHLGHRLADAREVYGIYAPRYTHAFGPLLNPNNLVGFLTLGLPICIALGLQQSGARRWAWFVTSATVAATGLLAGSRAGLLSILSAPVLFGVLYATRRRARTAERGSAAGVETAIFVVAILAIGFGLAELGADDFLDVDYRDLSKLEVIKGQAVAFLRDPHELMWGVGRGAYRVASARLAPAAIRLMHAECLPLQYTVEYGVIVATPLLGLLGWRVIAAIRHVNSTAQLGALVGLVVVGLQNLVDFGLELTGMAVPAAACLGACLPARRRTSPLPRTQRSWLVFAMAAFCALLTAALARDAARHDILIVENKLKSRLTASMANQFWELFVETVRHHPADPELASLAAFQRVLIDAPDAPFWLNRAMSLSPASGKPHLWAAHWLANRGRWSQAEAELANGAELEPHALIAELCSWLSARPSAAFSLALAPAQVAGRIAVLNQAAACLAARAPQESTVVDAEILRLDSQHPVAHFREARRLMQRGDFESALKVVRRLRQRNPWLDGAFETESAALIGAGRAREAVDLLSSALAHVKNPFSALFHLATAEAHAKNAVGMRDAIDRLRIAVAGNNRKLADVMAHLSECERLLGNDARAFKAIQEARRLDDRVDYRLTAAVLAEKLGQVGYALRAYDELCRDEPTNATYCNLRDRVRDRLRNSGTALSP